MELLLAFEEAQGLSRLSETLGKDPSVVSRGLQRIAETQPVLVKVKGRWELTPLGRQTNVLTRNFIDSQKKLFPAVPKIDSSYRNLLKHSVLIVINAQVGLQDPTLMGRNNSEAEENISRLLDHWRIQKRPIIHIKHVSDNPNSIFYRGSSGSHFLPAAVPLENEKVLEKMKASAFVGTGLEDELKIIEPTSLVLVGFTANECIDATARDAATVGFTALVVSDATAMFDLHGPDGKLLKAERLHKLTMAHINAYYGQVVQTTEIIL